MRSCACRAHPACFLGSAVTYDIRAKASILGVDRGLLEREGAVHPEVARQMAASVAGLYGQPEYADRVIGLSTTGVAGPDRMETSPRDWCMWECGFQPP